MHGKCQQASNDEGGIYAGSSKAEEGCCYHTAGSPSNLLDSLDILIRYLHAF